MKQLNDKTREYNILTNQFNDKTKENEDLAH